MSGAITNYHDLVRHDVIERTHGQLGRVLDFGGGIGATSSHLKAAGRAERVVVADLVEGERPVQVDATITGDLNDLSAVERLITEEGPFDTILALDILEHLYDPWAVVGRLVEGLAPGGRFITSIPNVNYVGLVGPLVLSGKWELQDDGLLDRTHIRWFTKDTARSMLELAGLRVVTLDDTIMPPKYKPLDRITFGAFRRFFVTQYFIVGTPR